MPRHNADNYRPWFMQVIRFSMEQAGKDPDSCALCGKRRKTMVHHAKYEGATIRDLHFVCTSCNLKAINKNLE